MNQRTLAYVAPEAYAFVKKDVEGLRAYGVTVHAHMFGTRSAWQVPVAMLRQLMFLLRVKRAGVRTVLAHFAGYHTILPVLLGFRTHIIIAGADACSFPGIAYGSFRKPMMRRAMAFSMRRAETLMPVHASLERFTNSFSRFGPREQGYARFVPRLQTPSVPITYGFDAQAWSPGMREQSRQGALCMAVGTVSGNAIHFRKGVDLIMEAARAMPAMSFTVVGSADVRSYTDLPANLTMLGRVSQGELSELLHRHSIYLQPSVMEGFPNALCEAMLCGCIPIVSHVTSMPGIVGDIRLVVPQRESHLLVDALNRVLALSMAELERLRELMRERAGSYTMDSRISALLSAIEEHSAMIGSTRP